MTLIRKYFGNYNYKNERNYAHLIDKKIILTRVFLFASADCHMKILWIV